jgi:hypothetical protein
MSRLYISLWRHSFTNSNQGKHFQALSNQRANMPGPGPFEVRLAENEREAERSRNKLFAVMVVWACMTTLAVAAGRIDVLDNLLGFACLGTVIIALCF